MLTIHGPPALTAPSSAIVPSAESATEPPTLTDPTALLVSVAVGVELEAHEPSEEVWKT